MEKVLPIREGLQRKPLSKSTATGRAIVVGLYGIPGCGKLWLLRELREQLGEEDFAYFEGSEVINRWVIGGLAAFQACKEAEKAVWREFAIEKIQIECLETGKVGVVTGHYSFWSDGEEFPNCVYTKKDFEVFTHILYLDVPADVVLQRSRDDKTRTRSVAPPDHILKWQQFEQSQLRGICHENGILFSVMPSRHELMPKVVELLHDFPDHDENHNLTLVEGVLHGLLPRDSDGCVSPPETMLVLDADGTLTVSDTGAMFWEKVSSRLTDKAPLKTLFSSSMGYSYIAFRQATLLCEEVANEREFEAICQSVASEVVLYPEFVSLLKRVEKDAHVGALIISCGICRVWEIVLEKVGLSQAVNLIAGGLVGASRIDSSSPGRSKHLLSGTCK